MKPHLGFLQSQCMPFTPDSTERLKNVFVQNNKRFEDDYLKEYLYQVSKRLKSRDSYPNALNVVITVINLSQEITKMLTVYCRER